MEAFRRVSDKAHLESQESQINTDFAVAITALQEEANGGLKHNAN
jgi:hypothetical protein